MELVPRVIVAVLLLHIVMIVSPGSDYALIMRTVGRQGRLAGTSIALGFGTGSLSLLLMAIFGINTIFIHYPVLMNIVRYLGAIWLFWQALLCIIPQTKTLKSHSLGSFGTGFLNHFINIEMVIFYIAVVGQLSLRNISTMSQIITALAMALFTMFWFMLVAFMTSKLPHGEKILNHLVTRIVFCVLFLISAAGLLLI